MKSATESLASGACAIRVETILEHLAAGNTMKEVLAEFPSHRGLKLTATIGSPLRDYERPWLQTTAVIEGSITRRCVRSLLPKLTSFDGREIVSRMKITALLHDCSEEGETGFAALVSRFPRPMAPVKRRKSASPVCVRRCRTSWSIGARRLRSLSDAGSAWNS